MYSRYKNYECIILEQSCKREGVEITKCKKNVPRSIASYSWKLNRAVKAPLIKAPLCLLLIGHFTARLIARNWIFVSQISLRAALFAPADYSGNPRTTWNTRRFHYTLWRTARASDRSILPLKLFYAPNVTCCARSVLHSIYRMLENCRSCVK